MNLIDLIRTAIGNTMRAKGRTLLTVLAIFVGAFTLTLTSGVGTGINRYIDDTVSAIGATDSITVTKNNPDATAGPSSGPSEYDPNVVAGGFPGQSLVAITEDDLETLKNLDSVKSATPIRSVSLDYVQLGDGKKWVATVVGISTGQTLTLAAGSEPDNTSNDLHVSIPVSYVEPLGFDTADAAIGQTLSIALTDALGTAHTVDAEIVGVAEPSLAGPGGSTLTLNNALTTLLYDTQNTGLPAEQMNRWAQVNLTVNEGFTDETITELKDALTATGFTGITTADILGAFTTVIDAIVLILNAFAVIALVAAGFGIVNTLLMSVQERTREIGLMKAMGMSSSRVFTLFSIEAVYIGFLGSAIGVLAAIAVGSGISSVLSTSILADLPGLQLIAFDPVSVASTILLIMFVAFLAGTIPAARAARKNPVEALRHE